METVPAKQILTPMKPSEGDFFSGDFNMNLYRGCCHGCVYCDSRSECYHLDRFDTVRRKENALALLRAELMGKRRPGLVCTGAMSDPYNPFEAELNLTRQAFELLLRHGFGAAFTTKSALAARDQALLAQMGRRAPVRACFSITCAQDDLCRRLEPHASPTSQRFQALSDLAAAGVFGGVWLNPVLPFLTDDWANIRDIVIRTKEAGGRFVVCHFGMTLRAGNREYFFQALDRDFPGVKERYLSAFHNDYLCPSPRAAELSAAFIGLCDRLGLLWRFSDINRALAAEQPRQLTFL